MGKSIIKTQSGRETRMLGISLGALLLQASLPKKHAIVIALKGELGSGKTTFAQGVAKGLGIKNKVLSPTFVIMKPYPIPGTPRTFFHVDCYRIERPADLLGLGWKAIMADARNIVLLEWPERVSGVMPRQTIFLNFKTTSRNKRIISVNP